MPDLIDHLFEKFSKSIMKKNKGVATTPNNSSSLKNQIISSFILTKNNYSRELKNNLSGLISGKISKDEYLVLQRSAIKTAYENSYLAGKTYSQTTEMTLGDDERRSLAYQTTQEMSFMTKFADDVINQGGKMNYFKRLQMYVDGLNAVFMAGRVAYLPEQVEIIWQLGETDKHCVDCLSFAANSPYSKKTLPTLPRAGNSRCLSNCRCRLNYRFIGSDDKHINFVLENYVANGNIPSENAVENLSALRDGFYYWRGLSEIDQEKSSFDMANEYKQQYFEYIQNQKLAVKKDLPVSKYLAEIRKFNKGFMFTRIPDFEINEVVCVYFGIHQYYLSIRNINGNVITGKSIYGEDMTFDMTETIVFRLNKRVS